MGNLPRGRRPAIFLHIKTIPTCNIKQISNFQAIQQNDFMQRVKKKKKSLKIVSSHTVFKSNPLEEKVLAS